MLHSADQGARVYGELIFPEDGKAVSLAASLLGAGFARYVDWSARLLPLKTPAALASASALKKAETTAQVPPPDFVLKKDNAIIVKELQTNPGSLPDRSMLLRNIFGWCSLAVICYMHITTIQT